MKVSIITVCFNSEATIDKTLKSVAIQNYPFIEHIIIDGGSTDSTIKIIAEYSLTTKRVISEPDKGIYDAMNKGLSMATGDIIGILNSDDFYCRNDVIESASRFLTNNPEFDGVYSDLVYVDRMNTNKVIRKWKAGSFNPKNFYWGWMPPHPTIFFKKEVYHSVGHFNLSFRSAADYEFLIRACIKFEKKLHYLPGTTVYMRAGGMSNANLKNRLKANAEDRLAWKVNGLKGGYLASFAKPIRKIFQFLHLL